MTSSRYQLANATPLTPLGYSGVPGQPAVQCAVSIVTDRPKDHMVWSIFNLVHANFFCLGLAALIYSVKARDQMVGGDLDRARRLGSTARNLNIVSTILFVLLVLAIATLIIIIATGKLHIFNPLIG